MPVVPFKSYPLADRNMRWSFTAADGNALIESGGWSLFKSVHTWYEGSGTPETKSAYKLPHHKKVGDQVKTVWRGVVAAMAILLGARGGVNIPEEDRRGCYRHLSRHYHEFDEEPPEYGRYTDGELAEMLVRYGFSEEEIGEILEPQTQARRFGKPTPSQLELINSKLPKDATPLQLEEVFVFTAKLIGDGLIPDRYHRISLPLMRKFRDDAKSGVALLLDHSWATSGGLLGGGRPKPAIPYGKTFDAVIRNVPSEDETHALFADHYIVRGVEIDGINTDAIIRMVETGTMFDTSIGFSADKPICSICGKDYRTCEHFAGHNYDGKICEIHWYPPGFLMENSIVFDGVYPGAGILSPRIGNQGAFPVVTEDLKHVPLGTQMFMTHSAKAGLTLYVPRGTEPEGKAIYSYARKEADSVEIEKQIEELRMQLKDKTDALAKAEATIDELKAEIGALEGENETLRAEVAELKELASYGQEYIKTIKADVLKWGVKAFGNSFKADFYENLMEKLSVSEIKELREQFEAKAREEIPVGRMSKISDPGAEIAEVDPSNEKSWRAAVAERARELRKQNPKLSVKESIKLADQELRKEVG